MAPQRDAASRIAQPPPSTKRRSEVTRRMTDGLSPGDRSLLLDLAYEEFCQREDKGERVDVGEFCRAYPGLQHSLARMIEVHVALRSTSIGNEPTVEPKWPQVGETWLGWKLIEPLGRGAFSRVFLAIEPELGDRKVVVKCTPAGAEEAYILGKLSHPHIVPILSVKPDKDSGLTGICMPYLGRRTLADGLNELLEERAAPRFRWFGGSSAKVGRPTRMLPLVEKIARALAAAHGEKILHGDIKPSNILVSFDNEPLLADFNLSRNLAADAGRLGGTPPYMAPEVLRALLRGAFGPQTEILTAAADQYSLGIVAYELLTGDLPYEVRLEPLGKLPFDQWPRHFCLPPPAKTGIDRRLYEILSRATAFSPDERFASVKEFAERLGAELRIRASRRWRRTITAGVLGVVIAFGGAAWAVSQMLPHKPPKNSPVAILEEAELWITAGEYQFAGPHLSRLNVTVPSDITEEWATYCFAKAGDWRLAQQYYLRIINKGRVTPELENNLGYCEFQLGNYREAEAAYTRAIEGNRELQAAYHGRALARFNLPENKCPPQDSWDDLQKAIEIGPKSAQLYRTGALILGLARMNRCPEFDDRKTYVCEALAYGLDFKFFEDNAALFADLDLAALQTEAAKLKRPFKVEATLLIAPKAPLAVEKERLKSLPLK